MSVSIQKVSGSDTVRKVRPAGGVLTLTDATKVPVLSSSVPYSLQYIVQYAHDTCNETALRRNKVGKTPGANNRQQPVSRCYLSTLTICRNGCKSARTMAGQCSWWQMASLGCTARAGRTGHTRINGIADYASLPHRSQA